MAFDLLAQEVVAQQSLGIDSVAGATVSSAGFFTAMADIVAQAWRRRGRMAEPPR